MQRRHGEPINIIYEKRECKDKEKNKKQIADYHYAGGFGASAYHCSSDSMEQE